MKRLRSIALVLGFFVAGIGVHAAAIPLFTGAQDPSQIFAYLNTLIGTLNTNLANYVTFNQANEVGEMAFSSATVVNGTSIGIVLPSGDYAYIKTSTTP